MAFNAGASRAVRATPGEVWEQVLSCPTIDESALRAVVVANVPGSEQAARLLWKDISPEKLTKLYQHIEYNQQGLAEYVSNLTMMFEAPGEQLATCRLTFSKLQGLKIVHNPRHKDVFEKTLVRIKTLIVPSLRSLVIGNSEDEGDSSKPCVDGFLSALQQCNQLRILKIRAHVRSSPGDFVKVLTACSKLETLVLGRHTRSLITAATLEAMTKHPSLTHLKIEKQLDEPLVSFVRALNSPFTCLTSLDISIGADAIVLLLSNLPQLRSLRATIHGTKTFFSVFKKLASLDRLELHFTEFTLMREDYLHLSHLHRLKELKLSGQGDLHQGLNMTDVYDLSFIKVLAQLANLQSFSLEASHDFDDDFIVTLGRSCKKLTSLSLSGGYKLVQLCQETRVIFPLLEHLELGDIISHNPSLDEDSEDQLAVNIAVAIRSHAPQLSTFRATTQVRAFDTLPCNVEGAWFQGTTHLSSSDWDEDEDEDED